MAGMLAYIIGVLAFFVLVGCFSRWLENRSERGLQFVEETAFVALASPSRTNAFDRRIEAAVREASRGYRFCNKCFFTSRVRAECCVLCGASFDDEGKEKAATGSNSVALSRRQIRARTRKHWVRQVDEEGSVVWNCTEENPDATPRFVLHVSLATAAWEYPPTITHTPVVQTEDASASPSGERVLGAEPHQRDAAVNDLQLAVESVAISIEDLNTTSAPRYEEVVEALTLESAQGSFDCVQVTSGCPAKLHLCSSTHTSEARQVVKDAVTNASADFPTKLAQFIVAMSTSFLSATVNEDGTTRTSRFNILRNALLSDSIEALATLTPIQARTSIRVDFVGEQGIDAGGVYREWFYLLSEQLLDPATGMFVCVDNQDQVFHLNPQSREVLGENHLAYFFACGRLVGRALLEGNVMGFHLALPLLKIILGLPLGLDDLEYHDPALRRNLQWLLVSDGVENLGLDFTVVEKLPSGKTRVVELVPEGTAINVTDANKHAYVDRKFRYLLFESVHDQLFAFLKGLYQVVPPEALILLDAEELDFLLAGSDDINVEDWQRSSQNSGNLQLHPALKNFWLVVSELSLEERRRLLQFATGSARVPPGGFAALTSFDGRQCAFTLHGMLPWRTMGFLRSHACFNRLDLPMHPDLKTMREAVLAAVAVDALGFTAN